MKSFDVVAETRRRWPAEERRRILAETEKEAVSVVARRHGVAVSLVFRWRRQAGMGGKKDVASQATASFVPVALPAPEAQKAKHGTIDKHAPVSPQHQGLIEIALGGGRLVRVSGTVDAEALAQVIAVLDGR